jgi:hypothetical protein
MVFETCKETTEIPIGLKKKSSKNHVLEEMKQHK